MVRAAHGTPAISSSICFFLADYLYQHPTIQVTIFVGLDICVKVAHISRGENINIGQNFPRKSKWTVRSSCQSSYGFTTFIICEVVISEY